MSRTEIIFIFISLIICSFVFCFVSFAIIHSNNTENKKNNKSVLGIYTASIFCILLILAAALKAVTRNGGVKSFLKRFLTFDIFYGDISRFAVLVLVFCAASLIIPIIAEVIIKRNFSAFFVSKRILCKAVLLLSVVCIPCLMGLSAGKNEYQYLEITGICRETVEEKRTEKINKTESKYLITNMGALTSRAENLWFSDDADDLKKRVITDIEIAPGDTYELTLTEDDRLNISKNGGSIVYLSDMNGNIVSKVAIPALKAREWYEKQDGKWLKIQKGNTEIANVPAPCFSTESGFYDNEFELSITADEGLTIYYTLDSSIPTVESSKYETPLRIYNRSSEPNVYRMIRNTIIEYFKYDLTPKEPVDKATVVRAVAVDGDGNISPIVTQTFFVGLDKYKNCDVVSLVSDPDGLFSDDNGIIVNGKEFDEYFSSLPPEERNSYVFHAYPPPDVLPNWFKKDSEWERSADFELFSDGQPELKQPVGIAVQGNSSRGNMIIKRFSLYSREEYSGSEFFDKIIVGNYNSHAVYLRNNSELFAIGQSFCANRNIANIHFRKVKVFLDGEYWDDYYLFDKYNSKNFARRFGLLEDNVVIAKNGEPTEKMNDGTNPYTNIYDPHITASTDKEYYDAYNSMVDIQSYIDYVCINHYLNNVDVADKKNCIVWHTVVPQDEGLGDGRWRFIPYDMDTPLSSPNPMRKGAYIYNMFDESNRWYKYVAPIREWEVWKLLKDNSMFRKQYALSYMDMINTTFSKEYVSHVLDKFKTSATVDKDVFAEFFEKRPEYAVPQVAQEIEISEKLGEVILSSNRAGTPIKLNTITPAIENGEWSGKYFVDYPVTVSANEEGFLRFEVTVNGKTTSYTDSTVEIPVTEKGVSINAIYK